MKKYLIMLKNLLSTTIKVFINKFSLDFYWRYLLLMPLDITFNSVPKKIKERIYIPLIRFLKKDFLFVTSFWTFVWKSVDAWARMHKDYEFWIREYIIKHYHTHKPFKQEVICVNIWSNQGRRAIDLAKSFDYTVVAFEAVPSIFNQLMANIYLSWLSHKVFAYNFAIWNEDWTISFHFSEEHEGKSHVDMSNDVSLLQLPLKKFDNLKLPIDYTHIKLFLIDVEWYEYDTLQWLKETLLTYKDIELIVEIHDAAPTREKTFSFMKTLWFVYKRLKSTEYDYLFYRK